MSALNVFATSHLKLLASSAPAKRTRSASIASDRTTAINVALGRDATPINTANGNLKATPAPTPTTKASNSRNRRATARKTQVQDLGAAEGEEGMCRALIELRVT